MPFRDATQRRVVEVIEVVMREVDVVRLQECLQDRRVWRKVPPRTPVTRSRQPRVDENPLRSRFDEETRVANHREPHGARLWHFGCCGAPSPLVRFRIRADRQIVGVDAGQHEQIGGVEFRQIGPGRDGQTATPRAQQIEAVLVVGPVR